MRLANTVFFWILPIFVVLCLSAASWYFRWPARRIPNDLKHATIDELITLLPNEEDGLWDASVAKYTINPAVEELKRRLDSGTSLTDKQWREALINSGTIRVRNDWPTGVPFAVSMRDPRWLGLSEIRFVPRMTGLTSAMAGMLHGSTCGTFIMGMRADALYQELGTLSVGRHQLEFDVTIERGKRDECYSEPTDPPPGVLWKGLMTFTIDVVASEDDVLQTLRGLEVDSAVRASIQLVAYKNEGSDCVAVTVEPNPLLFPALSSTALSLQVEVRRNEEVVEVAECYDSDDVILECLPIDIINDENAQKDWSIRIIGTTKDVLKSWNATRRWSGEIIIPLRELLKKKL